MAYLILTPRQKQRIRDFIVEGVLEALRTDTFRDMVGEDHVEQDREKLIDELNDTKQYQNGCNIPQEWDENEETHDEAKASEFSEHLRKEVDYAMDWIQDLVEQQRANWCNAHD
jgi:phage/plasmid-associated DNA primase